MLLLAVVDLAVQVLLPQGQVQELLFVLAVVDLAVQVLLPQGQVLLHLLVESVVVVLPWHE